MSSLKLIIFQKFHSKIIHRESVSIKFLFAITKETVPSLPQINTRGKFSLPVFCQTHHLLNKEDFSWNVGDAGAKRVLLELPHEMPAPSFFYLEDNRVEINWLSFPEAVRQLQSGYDKNTLQLAVQYLAAGGIDNSVIAADMDEKLLRLMEKENEEK